MIKCGVLLFLCIFLSCYVGLVFGYCSCCKIDVVFVDGFGWEILVKCVVDVVNYLILFCVEIYVIYGGIVVL